MRALKVVQELDVEVEVLKARIDTLESIDILSLLAVIARTKNITGWNAMSDDDKIQLVKDYVEIYKTIRLFLHDKV